MGEGSRASLASTSSRTGATVRCFFHGTYGIRALLTKSGIEDCTPEATPWPTKMTLSATGTYSAPVTKRHKTYIKDTGAIDWSCARPDIPWPETYHITWYICRRTPGPTQRVEKPPDSPPAPRGVQPSQAPAGAKPSEITLVCGSWVDMDFVTSPGSGRSRGLYSAMGGSKCLTAASSWPDLIFGVLVPPKRFRLEPWNQSSGC